MDEKHKRPGARHKARRRGVDLLFEAEARGMDPAELARERRAYNAADDTIRPVNDFTMALLEGVSEHGDRIDDTVSSHLESWTLERLPAVDRAILRIAVWELFYTEVPPVVAVDEAVELAKTLSTDESPSYVNGVLGRIVTLAPQVRAAAAAVPAAQRGNGEPGGDGEAGGGSGAGGDHGDSGAEAHERGDSPGAQSYPGGERA